MSTITINESELEMCITAVREMRNYWKDECATAQGVFEGIAIFQYEQWGRLLYSLVEKEEV
jgi:hypothetical protein